MLNEQTLFKVREGLLAAGLTETQIMDSINQMQNRGILFREHSEENTVTVPRYVLIGLWNYGMEYLDPGDRWDDESVAIFREAAVALGNYPDDFKPDWGMSYETDS